MLRMKNQSRFLPASLLTAVAKLFVVDISMARFIMRYGLSISQP